MSALAEVPLADGEDEISVEFGLELTAMAELVVAHANGKANLEVVPWWNSR